MNKNQPADKPSTYREVQRAQGRKLSIALILDALTIGGVLAIGGMVFWFGQLSTRVDSLEAAERGGQPRPVAAARIRENERGMAVLKQRSKTAEKARKRIERKVDGLGEKLDRIIESLRRK